ncbi:Uncharacterised protein [Streptococcus suis]|uniref:Uncharacterized protein n=1 Tax=Streptococcus suis TaxID=1307 RepID=A0A0Z8KUW3_STRSU|nr:Uncharacterised protein [Streptococcus suis]CYW16557.1 Uncharacterised protein [Streptococcus suis]
MVTIHFHYSVISDACLATFWNDNLVKDNILICWISDACTCCRIFCNNSLSWLAWFSFFQTWFLGCTYFLYNRNIHCISRTICIGHDSLDNWLIINNFYLRIFWKADNRSFLTSSHFRYCYRCNNRILVILASNSCTWSRSSINLNSVRHLTWCVLAIVCTFDWNRNCISRTVWVGHRYWNNCLTIFTDNSSVICDCSFCTFWKVNLSKNSWLVIRRNWRTSCCSCLDWYWSLVCQAWLIRNVVCLLNWHFNRILSTVWVGHKNIDNWLTSMWTIFLTSNNGVIHHFSLTCLRIYLSSNSIQVCLI